MEQFEVFFSREDIRVRVDEGTTLLDAQRQAGLIPNAPCSGQGTCGKCVVKVLNGPQPGVHRACQVRVDRDLTVDTRGKEQGHAILTGGTARKVSFDPVVRSVKVTIPKMKLGGNLSNWARLRAALETELGRELPELQPDLGLASDLAGMLKKSDTWHVILSDRKIFSVSAQPVPCCTVAFDIGTTTVVGYLLDETDGTLLATESRVNPQSQYGADVIMRANYALENGTQALSSCIRSCLSEILRALCEKAGRTADDIYALCIVGNTCMHHLLLGISPASLALSPYNPAVSDLLILKASDYDLSIHPGGELILLPNIAGFVGADTMGCLLCTRPDLDGEYSLMIDIGTNGEMVLGNRDHLVTCSTAAGPAFEGAKIECGMRGAQGAVDHVTWENGSFRYTTVGGGKAVGICGSGLIDLVAALRKAGIVDETGTLDTDDEGSPFILVPAEESGTENPVYLSQRDVREVQLAKAAIAAGIRILLKTLNLTEDQVSKVCIAGAFGNYMDPGSAAAIGLIPRSLRERIVPIGNAAGEGAKLALLSAGELARAGTLAREISFAELASSPDFQDCFVDELEFPEFD